MYILISYVQGKYPPQTHYENEKILITGDTNGHIGILNEQINRNGNLLLQFTQNHNLNILNITNAIGQVTWQRGNQKAAIDYVIINNKLANEECRVCIDENRQIETYSDHNILITEMAKNKKRQENKEV